MHRLGKRDPRPVQDLRHQVGLTYRPRIVRYRRARHHRGRPDLIARVAAPARCSARALPELPGAGQPSPPAGTRRPRLSALDECPRGGLHHRTDLQGRCRRSATLCPLTYRGRPLRPHPQAPAVR